uniref:protein-serine/threonine phosphatase n=1 Tax=Salix viminalis TaxID=40686 RepID=A0A6N2LM59_SALVM
MGIYLNSPKTEKFLEDGENCRLRYGLSSMQGWRAPMEDAHAAITYLDATTSFFGVYDGHGGKVVVKFCSKFLHQQVLKNEAYAAGDIGTSVQAALFRLLDFITKEFFLSPSRRVFEVSSKVLSMSTSDSAFENMQNTNNVVVCERHVSLWSRNHENEKLLKGLDVMKSMLHSAPSHNTRLLPQGSAGVLDGKTTLLQGGGTPSQPGFDTRDELIGQTPQPVAPAVPAIPSSQKPLPLTTSVQILDEALQCVEELKDPAFHPEVTKEAISLALEKSPPCVGPVIRLLEFLLIKKVLKARDIGTGLDFEVLKELLEKLEDNRFRKAIFEEHQLKPIRARSGGNTVMGIYLSSPKTEKFSEEGGNGRLRYGLSSMQGWHATMEDAHAAITDLDATTSFLIAMEFLHQQVLKNEAYAAGDIGTSLQKAFFRVLSLTSLDQLVVAQPAYSLSRDHKPDLEAEKERILKAGGFIHAGQVNDCLNLARAIGDVEFKQNKFFPAEKQIVTANPDINTVELCDDDDFLVLACDGISV